jgi:hypothetical protein
MKGKSLCKDNFPGIVGWHAGDEENQIAAAALPQFMALAGDDLDQVARPDRQRLAVDADFTPTVEDKVYLFGQGVIMLATGGAGWMADLGQGVPWQTGELADDGTVVAGEGLDGVAVGQMHGGPPLAYG